MDKHLSDYNIILVNLDGLRQDKIEFCDHLNSLKEKSIYFPNMITVSPYTLSAHHSIITGLYPSQHGIDSYYHMFRFKKNLVTIPELLKRANYFTRCDIQLETLMTRKGFDEYNVFDEHTVDYKTRHRNLLKDISKHDKFFLFLQYSKLHTYLVSEVMSKTEKNSNDDEYFNNIQANESRFVSHLKECDDVIGNIMSTLDELQLLDKTIVIVTADHGTSFGEKKGEKFYGTFVYDYTIKVFCIMYIPNETHQVVQNQCSSIDIFPTIAEIVGLNLGDDCNNVLGKSLFNFIHGLENDDREVFVETGGLHGPWPSPKQHNVFCVRKNNKKLIYNDTPETWEFYDLKNDPKEVNNIHDENSQDVIEFKNRLLDHLKILQIKTKLTPDIV
jgi:arylsulfatase A-like enzyme